MEAKDEMNEGIQIAMYENYGVSVDEIMPQRRFRCLA